MVRPLRASSDEREHCCVKMPLRLMILIDKEEESNTHTDDPPV